MLFGDFDAIRDVQVTENVAENPERHFEIDPKALFAALRAERAGGPKLAGYWHSHPSGDATPSAVDAAMAEPDGKLWLILGAGDFTVSRATIKGFVAVGVGVEP